MASEALKAAQGILQNKQEGILQRWLQVEDLLLKHGLAYKQLFQVEQLCAHPLNRGGVGIHHAGASVAMLHGSVCIEMSQEEHGKKKDIAFNEKLIIESNGMMSPLTGQERFLAVSSCHTSQSCKEAELADAHGKLAMEVWQGDQQFVPSSVMTELELAVTVATTAEQLVKDKIDFSWETLAQHICRHGVVAAYAPVVGTLVQLCGGAKGSPLIHFLHSFQKQHASSMILGKDFIKAITDLKLAPDSLTPMVRLAALIANLCAPEHKCQDGIARLLVKSDIEKWKSKKLLHAVLDLEETL